MKIPFLFGLLSAVWLYSCQGQAAPSAAAAPSMQFQDTPFTVVSKGADQQVWQRTAYEILPSGQTVPHVHQFVELATGLNHLVNGQWVVSSETIAIAPDGNSAAATNGQNQAYFPGNIYTGAIQLITSDGKILRSQPIGLGYDDGTNSVLFAVLTNSPGAILPSGNQVIYQNAFTGLDADLLYTYTKAGFEQDVVVRSEPPTPESLGLNPTSAKLQVFTEFFNPPQPVTTTTTLPAQAGVSLADQSLDFGVTKMGMGRAFLIGDDTGAGNVLVGKQWVQVGNRQILVEEVPVEAVADQLGTLPLPQGVSAKAGTAVHPVTSRQWQFPLPHLAQTGVTDQFRRLAASTSPGHGLVLDYVTFNANQTNYTFQADTTYYISGSYSSWGTNSFEGETVFKFATNGSLNITPGSTGAPGINWKAGPYRPVIFTAKDDNTVGESIGTGSPTGYYGNPMLLLASFSSPATLTGLRMSYAQTAVEIVASGTNVNIYDAQFIKCQNGLNLINATAFLGNALFANTATNFIISGSTLNAQNATFSGSRFLAYGGGSLVLTNCILANVTNLVSGSTTTNGNNNGFYSSPLLGTGTFTSSSYPFQAVGAGNYYLANGCNFFNQGTTNINSTLLADLAQKTTYPPLLLSNQTILANITFPPQAQRDIDTPDLGYHYDPIDYLTDKEAITNATLTIGSGTAIACYNEPGIQLQDGSAISSIGTPLTPNWLVRYQSVQEQPLLLGGANVSSGQNVAAAPSIGPVPMGTFQFSKFACPASGGTHLYDNGVTNYSSLLVQNCEFWGGQNNFTGATNTTAMLKNNLFYRSSITAIATNLLSTLSLSNNLVYGTAVTLRQPTNTVWYAFNNDFDSCGITNSTLTNGYNGYVNSSGRLNPNNANDIVVSSFTYTIGPLGNFYQVSTNFVDKGSCTADLAGLYHYTTQTNETKETTSQVDIGYHYVAVDGNGLPIDTNGDGIPDYLQDANGNGSVDTGEIDWSNAGDPGLNVLITRPRNGSTVP